MRVWPHALFWNLTRLAECLLVVAERKPLEDALGVFAPTLQEEFTSGMLWRLGLQSRTKESDAELARAVWMFLAESKAPFEQMFFDWYGGCISAERAGKSPSKDFYNAGNFTVVRQALQEYSPFAGARTDHSYFSRSMPCTMLIDEVEAIWAPIAEKDDWTAFQAKLDSIAEMGDAFGNPSA